MTDQHFATSTGDSGQFWEQVYRDRTRPPSETPNPILAGLVAPLAPGRALDLGCALGDDAIWLATRAWQVTAVDISATALSRASHRADTLAVGDRIKFDRHDLASTFPEGEFELVYALFLQSPIELGRDHVLRRAARAVAPGGRLLALVHGSIAPWSWNQDLNTRFPTPKEALAQLTLQPDEWNVEISSALNRQATGPNGQVATVTDIVTAVYRREDRP